MAKILMRAEMKEVLSLLADQFGFGSWDKNLVLIKRNDRLWAADRRIFDQNISGMRAEVMGIYFGVLEPAGVRLSVEGAQIVGPKSKKNIVEIDDGQLDQWLRGFDLDTKIEAVYVLLKHGEDFAGCGKRSGETIMNTVPKERRIRRL